MPRLLFANVAVARPRRQLVTLPISIGLHGALLAVVVVAPLLARTELPDVVYAFHVEPLSIPIALPPPGGIPGRPVKGPISISPISDAQPNQGKLIAPPTDPTTIEPEIGLTIGTGCGEGCVPGGDPTVPEPAMPMTIVGGLPLTPRETPRPLRAVTDVREPRKIHHVPPVYPPPALMARLQGDVLLDCVIGTNGRVDNITVISGLPILRDAAVEAVRQWMYLPTLVNGVPRPVLLTVTVQFRINPH